MVQHSFPRMNMRQVLENARSRRVRYHAVVLDPETGARLATVLLYLADAGECVDLAIEAETVQEDER
jgi:hypothetical protein